MSRRNIDSNRATVELGRSALAKPDADAATEVPEELVKAIPAAHER